MQLQILSPSPLAPYQLTPRHPRWKIRCPFVIHLSAPWISASRWNDQSIRLLVACRLPVPPTTTNHIQRLSLARRYHQQGQMPAFAPLPGKPLDAWDARRLHQFHSLHLQQRQYYQLCLLHRILQIEDSQIEPVLQLVRSQALLALRPTRCRLASQWSHPHFHAVPLEKLRPFLCLPYRREKLHPEQLQPRRHLSV